MLVLHTRCYQSLLEWLYMKTDSTLIYTGTENSESPSHGDLDILYQFFYLYFLNPSIKHIRAWPGVKNKTIQTDSQFLCKPQPIKYKLNVTQHNPRINDHGRQDGLRIKQRLGALPGASSGGGPASSRVYKMHLGKLWLKYFLELVS